MSKTRIAAAVGAGVLALATPLVMHFEGKRSQVYRDPINIPTVCYGHTGKDVRMGQSARSDAECGELLNEDLAKALAEVDRCAPGLPEAPRAAFTSFAFNVGGEKFCRSTLARKAAAGDLPGACAELSRWTFADGRELPGLVRRRAAERALCEEDFSLLEKLIRFIHS